MKYYNTYLLLLFIGLLFYPMTSVAQEIEEPTDDLGNVSDSFQENFFEALKQKGIENYELAIEALKKAEAAAKGDSKAKAVVYFEMGKNQKHLKLYDAAEENFKKVMETEGDRMDVMEALYDLYYQEKDYDAAIPLVLKLIEIDTDYKEDLANLYSRTKQFDKALEVLDELDTILGESNYRDALRSQIYRQTGNASGQIEVLEDKIVKNPKKEQDYLNLIYLYSEEGNTTRAYQTARELLQNNPQSELVHLALYKFYLDDGKIDEAIRSMKRVFGSQQIDKPEKFKVLGDFIRFVDSNPTYEKELSSVITLFSGGNDSQVFEKLGTYYVGIGKKKEALNLYEKGIVLDPDNFSLLKNTLLLQIDFEKFEEAAKLSAEGMEVFPAQSLIYLLNGVANNGLQKTDLAIESLEAGIDYLFDNVQMERDFYNQLAIAYTLKGNMEKANLYTDKALNLKDPN